MQHRPRPPTWRQVISALEITDETLCRVLLLPRVPQCARSDLLTVLVDHVRPILKREGRGLRAIPERALPDHPRIPPSHLRHLSPEQLSDYRLFQRKGFRAAEALAIVQRSAGNGTSADPT
jgi:hypothetical protein